MKRKIIDDIAAICDKTIEMGDFAKEPTKWLSQQMRTHELKYLLAHDEDGVIWGRLDGEELITSHDVAPEYSPPLREKTLQMVRIFAPVGELLVWRNESGEWVGRLIFEGTLDAISKWTKAFEEQQILLGTSTERRERGFTLMSEGSQGLFHVVPLNVTEQIDNENRPLRLVVRHYLQEDKYGFMRVNASRLFNLLLEPKESNT